MTFSFSPLRAVRAILHEGSLVLFPRGCAGCGTPDTVLCPVCTRLFTLFPTRPSAAYISHTAYACAWYQGAVRRTILAWKDHRDTELDAPLSHAAFQLARRWALAWDGPLPREPILIAPAPSSQASLRTRGRIHLLPVAREIAYGLESCGIAAHVAPLLAMRDVKDKSVNQSNARERAARISGHITASPQTRDRVVIIVDDIMTTGATLTACARAVAQAGGVPLAAFALAAVPLRARGEGSVTR